MWAVVTVQPSAHSSGIAAAHSQAQILLAAPLDAGRSSQHNIKANVLAPIARTHLTEELLGPLAPKLDPGLVAPVAAWLVFEDCPVSGEIWSAGGGRVARFFIGLTDGYANPALTPEDVRDHLDQIRDETAYSVPAGVADELSSLVERLR